MAEEPPPNLDDLSLNRIADLRPAAFTASSPSASPSPAPPKPPPLLAAPILPVGAPAPEACAAAPLLSRYASAAAHGQCNICLLDVEGSAPDNLRQPCG